jgi:hypothetical protein
MFCVMKYIEKPRNLHKVNELRGFVPSICFISESWEHILNKFRAVGVFTESCSARLI